MATLAQLIKGFRANVREGNPCILNFTGEKIHLYPPDHKAPNAGRTFIGVCNRPSHKPQGFMERERNDMALRSAEVVGVSCSQCKLESHCKEHGIQNETPKCREVFWNEHFRSADEQSEES